MENNDHASADGDELRVRNLKPSAIRRDQSERLKAVAEAFSENVEVEHVR